MYTLNPRTRRRASFLDEVAPTSLARPTARPSYGPVAVLALATACATGTDETVANANPPTVSDDAGTDVSFMDADDGHDAWPDSGDASLEACVPTCGSRPCGPDGCGAQCQPGCASGASCTSEGACDGGCTATFALDLANVDLAAIALDQDGLVVAGKQAASGYVARVGACGGQLGGTTAVDTIGFTDNAITAVALTAEDILLAGRVVPTASGDPGDALLARVDQGMFVPTWTNTIDASEGADRLNATTMDATGGFWAAGAAGETEQPWLVRADPPFTNPCGSYMDGLDGPGAAFGVSIESSTGEVFVTGQDGVHGFVASFLASDCGVGLPCSDVPCAPKWTASFDIGETFTVGRSIVAQGSYVFVAGYADADPADPTDLVGFVVAISLATGNVAAEHTWDPTKEGDAYVGLVSDGQGSLYAYGTRGWDGSERYAGGTRTLVKLVAPTLEPAWRHDAQGQRAALGAVLDSSDGVYVVSLTDSGSRVERCTKAGLCP